MLKNVKNNIKTRFKAIKPYLWMALGTMVFFGMVAFAEKAHKEAEVQSIEVQISSPNDHQFVKEADVLNVLRQEAKAPLEGRTLHHIRLDSLEKGLKANAFIKGAEVFSGLNGMLKIKIEQRNPVLRVINQSGKSFYIDQAGRKMPVSEQYAARVITATGHISESPVPVDSFPGETVSDLYKLCKFIREDDFLTSLTGSIQVDEYREFTITPRMGNNSIHVGDANDLEDKFQKLRVFYERVFPREGWYKYESINLKFDQQIIAKKAHYGKQ